MPEGMDSFIVALLGKDLTDYLFGLTKSTSEFSDEDEEGELHTPFPDIRLSGHASFERW